MTRQSARLNEIALRYSRERRQRVRKAMVDLRMAELRRLYPRPYGWLLPDHDAGCEDAAIAAQHLVQFPDRPGERIKAWLELWCPWATETEQEAFEQRRSNNRADGAQTNLGRHSD